MTDTPPKPEVSTTDPDPFYVGYLDTPPRIARAVRLSVVLIIIWLGMMSTLLVLAQRSPGEAVWDISNEQSWTGLLIKEPYPMLVTPDETLLVVGMGKFSVHERLADSFGNELTLHGYELQRQGRKMIELSTNGVSDVSKTVQLPDPELVIIDKDPQEFIGEIIDGKCYLGAMKPGDGFGHRACAVLCLRGGLPPMFAIDSAEPNTSFPLILIDGQAELPEHLYKFVAERVRLNAQQAMLGTLPVLLIEPDSITRAEHILPPPSNMFVVAPNTSD
jgi:hypothetical protein